MDKSGDSRIFLNEKVVRFLLAFTLFEDNLGFFSAWSDLVHYRLAANKVSKVAQP